MLILTRATMFSGNLIKSFFVPKANKTVTI